MSRTLFKHRMLRQEKESLLKIHFIIDLMMKGGHFLAIDGIFKRCDKLAMVTLGLKRCEKTTNSQLAFSLLLSSLSIAWNKFCNRMSQIINFDQMNNVCDSCRYTFFSVPWRGQSNSYLKIENNYLQELLFIFTTR